MGGTRFGVAEHLGAAELMVRQRAARDPVERGRWRMVRLLASGRSLREVADVTGYGTRWVREVVRRDNEQGPEGLADRRHANPGAVPLLDAEGRRALEAALAEPPPGGGLWTCARVAAWLAGRTGREAVPAQRGCGPTSCGAPGTARSALARGMPGRPTRRRRPPFTKAEGRRGGGARPPPRRGAVEVWASDGHRAGLKPVLRRVWAKRGRRPVAVAEPRYAWLDLDGFVRPTTGAVEWFPCDAVNTALFAAVLARFAAAVGAGPDRRVIPVLDGAGWHASERLTVPAGLRLEFLPPYSPELQPAERPWPLTDAALADRHFTGLAELDAALAERCLALCDRPEIVRAHTRFHWWPEAA